MRFKILVYACMNSAFSSREIQRLCQCDIHFIWLLNGYLALSHHSVNRFRKHHLSDGVMEALFVQLIERFHAVEILKSCLVNLKQRMMEQSIPFVYEKGKRKPFYNVKWKHSKTILKNRTCI